MATMGYTIRETHIAAANLTSAQFKFVTAGASGVNVTGAGAAADGVLLNQPASGEAATVANFGRVCVVAGGTIAAGANVASNASGAAVTASTGNIVLGKALEAGVSGQVITIDFSKGGNASA